MSRDEPRNRVVCFSLRAPEGKSISYQRCPEKNKARRQTAVCLAGGRSGSPCLCGVPVPAPPGPGAVSEPRAPRAALRKTTRPTEDVTSSLQHHLLGTQSRTGQRHVQTPGYSCGASRRRPVLSPQCDTRIPWNFAELFTPSLRAPGQRGHRTPGGHSAWEGTGHQGPRASTSSVPQKFLLAPPSPGAVASPDLEGEPGTCVPIPLIPSPG